MRLESWIRPHRFECVVWRATGSFAPPGRDSTPSASLTRLSFSGTQGGNYRPNRAGDRGEGIVAPLDEPVIASASISASARLSKYTLFARARQRPQSLGLPQRSDDRKAVFRHRSQASRVCDDFTVANDRSETGRAVQDILSACLGWAIVITHIPLGGPCPYQPVRLSTQVVSAMPNPVIGIRDLVVEV